MKKFWYFVMAVISGTIISCDSPENIDEVIERNPITGVEYVTFGAESSSGYKYTETIAIKKFKYEGHSYIWFNECLGPCSTGGAIHDPECEKCRTKE